MASIHLLIKGKVQGVFYRATAKKIAEKTGIHGWIRNTADGDVEAVISGTQAEIDSFIEWCRTGPEDAEVTDVHITNSTESVDIGFYVRH